MNKNHNKLFSNAFVFIIVFVGVLILRSIILYWVGYFSGWLAELVIGDRLIEAINAIFNTNFSASILPTMAGGLSWIGSFFQSSTTRSSK